MGLLPSVSHVSCGVTAVTHRYDKTVPRPLCLHVNFALKLKIIFISKGHHDLSALALPVDPVSNVRFSHRRCRDRRTRPGNPNPAPQPIQDNSFLVEEAYNQEYGVVQHINTFMRQFHSRSWVQTFTQEWPAPGERHQFSYTLSAVHNRDFPGSAGIGDLSLNYRCQLVGSGDSTVAFAPRVSLLVPAGDPRQGRGFGGYGVQLNLPASVALGRRFVTHWNAGATIVPHARDQFGDRALSTGYNLGQSVVWLAHPRFNALVETVWTGSDSVISPGQTQRSHDLLISPGIRWAYNLGGLQIVPGIGVPLGVGPSAGDKGLILYLSLEHPFRAVSK